MFVPLEKSFGGVEIQWGVKTNNVVAQLVRGLTTFY